MVRPSYVLGGRAMEIVYSDAQLERYLTDAVTASDDKPVLVDKYLAGAIELDVDALCDNAGNVTICGIMEHIEEAGVHSGDSACSLPPQTIPAATLDEMRDWTARIARELKVVGLINVQYCIKEGDLYIIEANPRASRTVPFVAKAVGHPIVAYASLLMSGKTLKDVGFTEEPVVEHVAVKEVVLPFSKFPGTDMLLGPEMRSTGAFHCLLCVLLLTLPAKLLFFGAPTRLCAREPGAATLSALSHSGVRLSSQLQRLCGCK